MGEELLELAKQLDRAERIRLINAGRDFGLPQFSKRACMLMWGKGHAERKGRNRWKLTPLGEGLRQAVVLTRALNTKEQEDG